MVLTKRELYNISKLIILEIEPGWELGVQSIAYGWDNMWLKSYSAVYTKQQRTIGTKLLLGLKKWIYDYSIKKIYLKCVSLSKIYSERANSVYLCLWYKHKKKVDN